jgi:hypothetical protein
MGGKERRPFCRRGLRASGCPFPLLNPLHSRTDEAGEWRKMAIGMGQHLAFDHAVAARERISECY